MRFTQSQFTDIIEGTLTKEDGLNTILKTTLEALMKIEHSGQLKAL